MIHKPIGRKSYGSIGHLPTSRLGPADHCITEGQARIATVKTRDKHDVVLVQEKLDGTNVSVARHRGELIPLQRSGYAAATSPYEQHHLFAAWALQNEQRFEFLAEGERLCGEWLSQAHSTRYALPHEPFVAFDLMREDKRENYETLCKRAAGFVLPHLIHRGGALSIEEAMNRLDPSVHGAIDPIEGAVWRVERNGKVDFLCKYVRPDKVDGLYLPGTANSVRDAPLWNWRPT